MTDRAAGEDLDARDLPEEPSNAPGEGSVHVVGTAHVSQESVDRARETIEERRPDVVAIELDEGRYRQLQGETPDDLDAGDLLYGNTVFQFLAYWMLSYIQTRLGDRQPGADMMAAAETAERLDLGIALVDRDVQTTVQRFWKRMTGVEKLKLVANLLLVVGPPTTVGLSVGATMGAFLGFGVAALGAGALGFAGSDFVALLGPTAVELVGALVGGAFVGLFIWALLDPQLARTFDAVAAPNSVVSRVFAGVVLGVGGGVAVAFAGGGSVGPLAVTGETLASIGGFVFESGTGVLVGAAVGGGLGVLVGRGLERFVPDDEEFEEFDVDELTDADVISAMMEEFRRFSPGGAEALIDERDAFIAHRLVALREAGYDVVAVVGAGHREGIERYLEDPEDLPPMESLVGLAEGSSLSGYAYKAVGYAITLGFLAFFVLLALGGASKAWLVELFAAWFLVNAICAGGLARLAGARWPSAAVGGGIAWLTSVNPLLAPGWFAGYMELRYQTVNVADIGRLNEILDDEEAPIGDIIARMREVPLFRLILVVALTNVGSMIASLVVFPAILPWLSAPIGGVGAIGGHLVDGAATGADIVWGLVS